MNATRFISVHSPSWTALEALLKKLRTGAKPDGKEFRQLTKLYRAVTSDYSYASTFFPAHDITGYLNRLVAEAHAIIYRRRTMKARLAIPWLFRTVPNLFRKNFPPFALSLSIFVLFAFTGFLGAEYMEEGESIFLSFSLTQPEEAFADNSMYINQTESNIRSGDPFAVYDSPMQSMMSSGIAFHNIRVAFFCFAGGIFAGLVTFYVLATNGMMVGAFFHIFYRHDIIFEFWNTVLLHGMIELTMIVFSAGAGFMIARGLLFPGSLPLGDSLRQSGTQAVQIVIAIALWLLISGSLEGFVTGLEMNSALKLLINFLSFSLLIFYWGFAGKKKERTALVTAAPA